MFMLKSLQLTKRFCSKVCRKLLFFFLLLVIVGFVYYKCKLLNFKNLAISILVKGNHKKTVNVFTDYFALKEKKMANLSSRKSYFCGFVAVIYRNTRGGLVRGKCKVPCHREKQ